MYEQDTIAAIATAVGEGAVAIVRVSGPDAERAAGNIFVRGGGKNGKLASHRLYHGKLQDPRSHTVVDEVLMTVMRKPRSYTGEDVVELYCHGGVLVVRRVLELVLSQGVRHAERGEFTKRAFLNGRIDLAQAEAVLDIIRARTDKGARLAVKQAGGELSHWVEDLREEFLDLMAQVEAAIDFSEEEIELLQNSELISRVDALRFRIRELIATYDWGRLLREGAKVCICGRPNVGKSSLLNALLGEKRAIVTSIPGTTRDVIEEAVNLDGLPVVLWDTAGIRTSQDEVERLGVSLSLQHAQEADAVMVVLDGSSETTDDDLSCLQATEGKKRLIVINKNDLAQVHTDMQLSHTARGDMVVRVSATTGIGLQDLKQSLRDLLVQTEVEPSLVVNNVRHRAALISANEALSEAVSAVQGGCPAELVAVSLQAAKERLEEITGAITNDDVLERIFSQFCLGK
ncbi:MAG TPA: tRNA uridine-5-carboxymethylaminomethyl(34) synthesis GTPase MnmE [Candidatus Binatia bacterium]|nr:tRNA uridine-5-carboxymethylaminomethyl(34) synthesis GTPase MnmE [Candidatus Binatia bacterium]